MSDDDNDDAPDEAKGVDGAKLLLIRQVEGAAARAAGRRYQIDLAALDMNSLRELARLLRDLEQDKDSAVRRARTQPWRG